MNGEPADNGHPDHGDTLAYDAFRLALLAADAVIAWHSGTIDADSAMAGLHRAFYRTCVECQWALFVHDHPPGPDMARGSVPTTARPARRSVRWR